MYQNNVIHIKLHQDLSIGRPGRLGKLLNQMRCNMELAQWRTKARKINEQEDWDSLDRLQAEYETIGLP